MMSASDLDSLFSAACARRLPLPDSGTDALRLVDGAADGLPDIVLESFAGRWLLSTAGADLPAQLAAWLRKRPECVYWKRLDSRQQSAPVHFSGPAAEPAFLIRENSLFFEISFESGYSQGIFLDQRDNRSELRRLVGPGSTVLNTFAYTGAFSVAAAAGGATTTTLDLSQPYLDWAKRNFRHNGLDPAQHHFCRGDTFQWLARFAKSGRRFDLVVLDPPTFSHDGSGRVFRVERDFGSLVSLALGVLAPGGRLLCCSNCHTLGAAAFRRQISLAAPRHLLRPKPMPRDFPGSSHLKSIWLEPREGVHSDR